MREICINPDEMERANKEIENLQYELTIQRHRLEDTAASLEKQRLEHHLNDHHLSTEYTTGQHEVSDLTMIKISVLTRRYCVTESQWQFSERWYSDRASSASSVSHGV